MIVVSYNIQYGFGADGRHDLSRLGPVVQGADLIALQEVERFWQRSGYADQPAEIEAMLPGFHAVYGPGFDMDASRVEGGRVVNRRRQFGPMILSRWPILWSRLHLLPMRRMRRPLNTQSAALEACIAVPGGPIRLINLHLAHVGVQERMEQIAALLQLMDRAETAGPPWSGEDDEPGRNWTEGQDEPPNPGSVIVLGDFNCEPGSAEMQALLGQAPYHPGAIYAGALVDAVARAGAVLSTHAKVIAGQMRHRQLDHILVSADLEPRIRRAWSDPAAGASDHYPLWLQLEPASTGAGAGRP